MNRPIVGSYQRAFRSISPVPASVEVARPHLVIGVGGRLLVGLADARRLGEDAAEVVIGEGCFLPERIGAESQPAGSIVLVGPEAEVGIIRRNAAACSSH